MSLVLFSREVAILGFAYVARYTIDECAKQGMGKLMRMAGLIKGDTVDVVEVLPKIECRSRECSTQSTVSSARA